MCPLSRLSPLGQRQKPLLPIEPAWGRHPQQQQLLQQQQQHMHLQGGAPYGYHYMGYFPAQQQYFQPHLPGTRYCL